MPVVTTNHVLGDLEGYGPTVWEVGSSKQRCWQDGFLLWAVRERSAPGPSAWLVYVRLHVHWVFPCMCVSIQVLPFYKDTSPIGLNSFSLDYISKDPFSK